MTTNDQADKEKYPCHNAQECTASWTYDDWHCSGCHWKGMGTCDLKYGDNDTEPCPNGCGPLWPVTWEQEAREGYKLAEDLFERAKRAEDALRELVALKDIKDERQRHGAYLDDAQHRRSGRARPAGRRACTAGLSTGRRQWLN